MPTHKVNLLYVTTDHEPWKKKNLKWVTSQNHAHAVQPWPWQVLFWKFFLTSTGISNSSVRLRPYMTFSHYLVVQPQLFINVPVFLRNHKLSLPLELTTAEGTGSSNMEQRCDITSVWYLILWPRNTRVWRHERILTKPASLIYLPAGT